MKNGQKLKLGDVPWTPQEISKRYKRQSLGMHTSSTKKHQVIFQHAIFLLLHMICVILGASLFLLCVFFCFVYCSIKLDPIIFYFGERHAPPVLHRTLQFSFSFLFQCSSFLVLRLALSFPLIFCSEPVSLLYLCLNSSLVFFVYYL